MQITVIDMCKDEYKYITKTIIRNKFILEREPIRVRADKAPNLLNMSNLQKFCNFHFSKY